MGRKKMGIVSERDLARRKWKKSGGKSNLTAKRVTIAPDFLSNQAQSKFVSRKTVESPQTDSGLYFENKDNDVNIGLICNDLTSNHSLRRSRRKKSKSIFKEIQRKFRKIQLGDCDGFSFNLFSQLDTGLKLRPIQYYKDLILEEISTANDCLGAKNRKAMAQAKKLNPDDNKENVPISFPLIPKSKWIFQTPPNRKFQFDYKTCQTASNLEPAVLATINDQKIIYGMNPKINVDLTKINNHQNVDIDKRYMNEVAVCPLNTNRNILNISPKIDKMFNLNKPDLVDDLESHFLSLTSRPKRKATTISRKAYLKPKRHDFESQAQPGCSGNFQSDFRMFEQNAHLVESMEVEMEQSFNMKFTESAIGDATNCKMFDFSGRLAESFDFQPDV